MSTIYCQQKVVSSENIPAYFIQDLHKCYGVHYKKYRCFLSLFSFSGPQLRLAATIMNERDRQSEDEESKQRKFDLRRHHIKEE